MHQKMRSLWIGMVILYLVVLGYSIWIQIQENDLIAQYGYWNDYRDYVARWTESGHGVYFSEDGTLNIVFGAYELASYAAGPQEFVIEQDVYKNYMNDYGKALLGIA